MKRYFVIVVVCAMAVAGRAYAQGNTIENDSPANDPGRKAMRKAELEKVYDAKNGEERERVYLSWIEQFPPKTPGNSNKVYDEAREAVALGYARTDNMPKALQYLSMLEDSSRRKDLSGRVAEALIVRGHLKEAEPLLQDAIENAQAMMAVHRGDYIGKNYTSAYAGYCDRYANLLYRQKNYPQALLYAQQAHDSASAVRAETNAHYAEILIALGKKEEAFNIIDEALNAGQVTESMRQELETLYKKVNGKKGYDEYMGRVTKQLADRHLSRLPSRMLNDPAPAFRLQDLNGNTVSLADFKGKTVVVDFWATWCGPCKASFPAMQAVVNKYKDSGDVKFLFIHTWEREGDATSLARDYIESMHYSFQVLMDLKNWAGGVNPVVKAFNVTGIPTKFVIDKNGYIRFRFTGFSKGSDAAAVDELSAMIQLAKKS